MAERTVTMPADLLKHGKPLTCGKCGKDVFLMRFKILKISKLVPANKTGRDLYFDSPVKQCASCKRILTQKDIEG